MLLSRDSNPIGFTKTIAPRLQKSENAEFFGLGLDSLRIIHERKFHAIDRANH